MLEQFLVGYECILYRSDNHQYSLLHKVGNSGLSGTMVACQPVIPEIVGSNPAEVVGFLGYKNSMAGMSSVRWHVKEPLGTLRTLGKIKSWPNRVHTSASRSNSVNVQIRRESSPLVVPTRRNSHPWGRPGLTTT